MIDLQKFCAEPEQFVVPQIKAPFSRGEYTYATNSHIALRLPRVESIPEIPPGPPSIEKRFGEADWSAPMRPFKNPIPEPAPPGMEVCPECFGSGKAHECPRCDHPCRQCKGSGQGTVPKKEPNREAVKIARRFFDPKYLRMIAALPGVMIAADAHLGFDVPLAFRFDGGDGLLMPLDESKMLNDPRVHLEVEL